MKKLHENKKTFGHFHAFISDRPFAGAEVKERVK